MNRILKNVHVAFSTLFFILGAAFVATKEESVPLHFQIQNEFGKQNISLFEAEDGNCYVFLPSYSELDKVQFILPPGQVFCLDDTRMSEKMTCEDFELEKPYAFSVDGEHVADLWFYQSRNVATMYIDTATGEMTEIHDDKTHEEYASMTIYTVDGKIDHFDSRCKIKGRGNSTWTQDKRPYLLTLSSDESLLNMGSAQKWVLLANAYDETNMNNKLVFDLASQVKFKWSPDSRFVDLYLNGEYSGLYLLAEKVEVHPNRLNIDISSGDFLCKVDTPSRIEQLKDYFKSSLGRIIEICTPNTPSDLEFDYIMHQIFLLEQELVSGTDLTVSEIVDLDSWIRRYLIDEISGNIDSDLTSSYFYLCRSCLGL